MDDKSDSQDDLSLLMSAPGSFNLSWNDCLPGPGFPAHMFDAVPPQDLLEDVNGPQFDAVSSTVRQMNFVTADDLLAALGTSDSLAYPEISDPLECAGTSDVLAFGGIPDSSQVTTPDPPKVESDPPEVTPVASLVAVNNWAGDYDFNVHFEETKSPSKGAKWTYSKLKDKIYVKKDVSCPIRFETNKCVPSCNTNVRAMVVFDQAQYVSDVVRRCFNHFHQDKDSGIPLAKHLVKCEGEHAVYEEDPLTRRLSVVMQYQNPPDGQENSVYIFKFTCWGSCIGGLNRRPIRIIFTLECGGRVVGRRSLGLRICACPLRDRMSDEKMFNIKEKKCEDVSKSSKRKCPKNEDELNGLISFPNCVGGQENKKSKCTSTLPKLFSVDNYGLYIFLKKMKKLYLVHGAFDKLPPHVRQALLHSGTSSSESSAEDKIVSEESD